MELIAKIGTIAALGSLAVPTTLVSTRGSRYSLFEEAKDPDFVPAKASNAHDFLQRRGYHEKHTDKLADFNKGRNVEERTNNFGLGCHEIIFAGNNVIRLPDTHYLNTSGALKTQETPIKDYFGKNDQPILGCSTSAVMESKWGKVYDFELALRRGDKGFVERVSVFDNTDHRVISQLIFYNKNHDPKTNKAHPWKSSLGLQRTDNSSGFKVGDPTKKTWTTLDIKNGTPSKPIYFSVWIADPKEPKTTSNPGMLENLGIKFGSGSGELFSSISKGENNPNWFLRLFVAQGGGAGLNTSPTAHLDRYKPKHTSEIAKELESSKGIWKDIKEFCASQESTKKGELKEADIYRLRDYCYTNKTKKVRN